MTTVDTLNVIDVNANSNSKSHFSESWEDMKGASRMEESIAITEKAVNIFFGNGFDESEQLCRSESDYEDNLYLKTAIAYKGFVYAVFSFEKQYLDQANEWINKLFGQLNKDRKSFQWSSLIFKTDYNDYTDEEAHAELIYAENNLMAVIMAFISDPTLLSVIRAAFRLKSSHNAYKLCGEILKNKTNWKSEYMRIALEDGYQMGWGYYNLLLSHMPDRVLKILAFVGFDCNRDLGLKLCHTLSETKRTYRTRINNFLICIYSFYLEQFFGCGTADKEWVKQITADALEICPEGALDLFFGARMKQLEGDAENAIQLFQACIRVQDELPTIHNVCTWDMLWSYAILCDWHKASECALFLHENCSWSKSTNLYQWACFQYMIMEDENRTELLPKIREAMKKVPEFKKRLAGKSLPPEKYAITKALAFVNSDSPSFEKLSLPAFELFYIWNIFGNTGENTQLLNPLLERIEKKMKQLKGTEDKAEDYFVMLLLRGICLRNLGKHDESIGCLKEILNKERDIKHVTHIPPHAAFELGISFLAVGRYDEAKEWLEKARDDYTGFLVESLVHLRIHGALQKLKELKKQTKSQ